MVTGTLNAEKYKKGTARALQVLTNNQQKTYRKNEWKKYWNGRKRNYLETWKKWSDQTVLK